jgi:nucleoporin NUP42
MAAQSMDETIQQILGDMDGAVDFVMQGLQERPNRIDIVREGSSSSRGSRGGRGGGEFAVGNQRSSNAFQTPQQSNSPAFGQPAAPSGFGQAAAPTGFGQPAFGQSPFGQQAPPSQPTGFGQSMQEAQPAFGQSPFGQPQMQNAPFGQQAANGFGQPQGGSPFDQSMQQDQSMNTGGFGQQQQQQPQQAMNFAQPTLNASPFGQGSMSNGGGFGAAQQQQLSMNNGSQMMADEPPTAMFGLSEEQFREAYAQANQNGGFQDGNMPMVAPKNDWIVR